MVITLASFVKIFIKGTDQKIATNDIKTLIDDANISEVFSPLFMRSSFPAPRFCPTKTESATESVMAGSEASESIRLAAVNAAITLVPNEFTIPISAIIPSATKVC